MEHLTAPATAAGQRLDKALAGLLPQYSRARLQTWIAAGAVTVNGVLPRPRDKLAGGETITVAVAEETVVSAAAQAIPLEIVYEDSAILVINKPAGLVVHPGAGNPAGTLLNALLHHAPELAKLPRAGIVHRLDKDTSGLLVVARKLEVHAALVGAMQARLVEREYEAVVCGVMTAGGTVDAAIGRHPQDRKRMTVRANSGRGERAAVTHYRVLERFRAHTYVRVKLETGRTHQIRVHFQHIRFPIVGDPVYGRRLALPPRARPELEAVLRAFRRQALHARRLALSHPL
ncbi:MAG: 23S rRNA pseudouridine(1911/1915/1917) synthase RluD, partial [Nevskiales bacterium]